MSVIPFPQLINRARMWLAGVQFGGRRDLYDLFGYERYVNHQNFTALYYRNGLAKRVVDMPVKATWADPPHLQTDNQEFMDAWDKIVQATSLWHNLIRLDKLAGLGQYAIMVVGFDDGGGLDSALASASQAESSSGSFGNWTPTPTGTVGYTQPMAFDKPVSQGTGRKVIYLQPYHQGALQISAWDTDTRSPRFGKPLMYNVNPGRFQIEKMQVTTQGANAAEPRQPFNVHFSRVVHVAENLMEDGVYGSSRLEAVYNDINDMMKVSGGGAELFWTLANRGMQLDVDKEIELSPEDASELSKEVEEYQHDIRRFIRTRGVTVKDLGSHTADPSGVAKVLWEVISAGINAPQQSLTGAAAGKIASAQDRANYADRIAERVIEYAEPVILKGVIDCFVNAGALPVPENLQINWPEAFKLNPFERSQASAQMARSAANLMKSHVAAVTAHSTTTTRDPEGNVITSQEPSGVVPLFSPEEMRHIVSFGKHPPVFDLPDAEGGLPLPGQDPALDATPTPAKQGGIDNE